MVNIEKLFLIHVPKDVLLLSKERTAKWLFYIGIIIAYLCSLNAWFFWSLGRFYIIISAAFVISAMLISATMRKTLFDRTDYLPPIMTYILLVFYQTFINNQTFNSYIANLFHVCVFFSLFHVNSNTVKTLSTVLAKVMAVILYPSIFFFLLYLIGYPLPSVSMAVEDYSYQNYYFFMVDDRQMFAFIPRFSSVFLEPGQLGTATVLLLLAQSGQWRRWYNVPLLVTTLITFSLAAYVLFFVAIFLSLWMLRRHMIRKLLFTIVIIGGVVAGSFVYNDGFNLLHDLIIMRLEVQDGELAGDNRVTDTFQADYNNFLDSGDIFTGKDFDRIWGSAGYKVYFYDYGLVGLFLLAVFYVVSMTNYSDRRAFASALIIATLNFIVRDFPLWYAFYIPVYVLALKDFSIAPPLELTDNNLCSQRI